MVIEKKILEYKGTINYQIIGQLINEFKQKFDSLDVHIGQYKRVLSVVVESLENIDKYKDNFSEKNFAVETYKPCFSIEKGESGFVVKSGNPIKNEDVINLSHHIDYLQTMTHDEIKAMYKETIKDGHFSEKGGAGLGLIELAKSGNDLAYEFIDIDEDYSYYILKISVTANEIIK